MKTMTIKTATNLLSLAAALALGATLTTAQAALLTWDGGSSDDRIDRTANWNPDGVPTVGANSGVVNGSSSTTYYNNQTPAYEITYNDTSSLAGVSGGYRLHLSGGADFTFNDSSTLTVGETLYLGYTTAGGGSLTLTGNATASAVAGVRFGQLGPSGTAYSGNLTLQGSSSLTMGGPLNWQKYADQASLTHYITLADSAALTVNNTDVRSINSALLVVNFEQASNLYTPTWTLGEAVDFSAANIQYQINGTNTTLADSRFVQAGTSLSLTVIPEPSASAMLGLGALVTILIRRRRA